MPRDEQVLVVERRILEDLDANPGGSPTGLFQGLSFDVDRFLDRIFAPGVPRFMPRDQAEHDPTFKQLIPYVMLTAAGQVLTYVRGRRAGESRLVGQRSIGIGGHINPVDDAPLFQDDFRETYRAAVEREVSEEVAVDAAHTDRVVALINDDATEVGRVHLGIVHRWELAAPLVGRKEQMITQLGFMTVPELQGLRDTMETWSQFCLDYLAAESGTEPGALVRRFFI